MARNEGFKYWSDQEFVQGFDTNAYLMSQSVMRFDNSTDRDSALARTLTNGMLAYDKSTTTLQLYNGSSWVDVAVGTVGVTDHGALTGLSDDDHSQYHNDTRGDARYYTQTQVNTSLAGKSDTSHTHSYADVSHTHSFLPLSGGDLTGNFTVDTNVLYVDTSNDRVGIGTTSPTGMLHVSGSDPKIWLTDTDTNADSYVSASSSVGSLILSADENNEVGSSQIALKVDGSDKMVIQSTGNVGIGTTAPDNKLHVQLAGTSKAPASVPASHMIIADAGDTNDAGFAVYSSTTGIGYMRFGDSDASAQGGFSYTHTDNKLKMRSAGSDRVTIDSSGNVGINDTTPSYKLDVNGTGRFTGDVITDDLTVNCSSTELTVQGALAGVSYEDRDGSGRFVIYNNGNTLGVWNDTINANVMSFSTNGDISLRSANAVRPSIQRVGGIFFTWDSDSYGTNSHHSIRSTDGDTYSDDITINSYGNIRFNIDSNNNGSNHFYIQSHGTGTGNVILFIPDTGSGIYLEQGWFRAPDSNGLYFENRGGGWYMTDSTYIRNYNSKSLYLSNEIYVPNMDGTWSYNTVRFNSSTGQLMRYNSTTESKIDIVEINGVLGSLNERSFLYDLTPKLFREAHDRLDHQGNPLYTTRGEYGHGFMAEEILEVAPELAYYDQDGELTSYSNDALIPDIVAELQRLMPMIEELYSARYPDWVRPTPRPTDRAVDERQRYDTAAATQANTGNPNIDPHDGKRHLEDFEEV